jgi:SAM-dependent methyltransferase
MIKLHIGCFDVPLDGWYNTDITPHIFIARIPFLATALHAIGAMDQKRFWQHRNGVFRNVHYLNAVKRFPIANDSVDAVYCSHVLYNFSRHSALFCVKEVNRVLKPRGVFRVAVIDLDGLVQSYDPVHPECFLDVIYQPTIMGEKNHMCWSYNANSLMALLQEGGFTTIERVEPGKGKCPDVERIDYRPGSLFMEGIK